MKRLLLLLLFCFPLHAQEDNSGVDIAFMDLTGVASLDVFLIDVDKPDAEPVQFSHNFDISLCYENSDGSDEAFAECELSEYPPYLGVWQLLFENEYFIFENLETGERLALYRCVTDCEYAVSLDGRWLILEDYRLLDLSLFEETEAQTIGTGRLDKLFWLNEHQLLYWQNEYRDYFVYDTETSLHYPFETVLDRERLSVDVEGIEGFQILPDIAVMDTSLVPMDIQRHTRAWALRPDNAGVIYDSSDYEVPEPQYCDSCAVAYWDIEAETEQILFGLADTDDEEYSLGWAVQYLYWSSDGRQFVAGFDHINVYHQPMHFWLYDMETAEVREVFAGDWVQWLR